MAFQAKLWGKQKIFSALILSFNDENLPFQYAFLRILYFGLRLGILIKIWTLRLSLFLEYSYFCHCKPNPTVTVTNSSISTWRTLHWRSRRIVSWGVVNK